MSSQAYILAPHIALRSWERVPFAYVERFHARPHALSAEAFDILAACDGKTPLSPSAELDQLLARGLARPCEPGSTTLAPWQRHRRFPNRVTPYMCLEITARCNYNCIHCFNAADNERLHAQMSMQQVEKLLDSAQAMGVQAMLLTGGEPLMHPQFFDIVQAIYARDMFVFEINTNGRFISESVLDKLASFGYKPEMKISFDGLGFHDWMRGCEGAEADTLRAIELCVQKGFPTRAQININRKNHESILPTLEVLGHMGVDRARVIPTTPSTRWEMNAQGQNMSWEEYLQAFLEISAAYARGEHGMEVEGWHVATLFPRKRAFSLRPLRYSPATFKPSRPCCAKNNGMPSIAADGELYPCLQCSGWFSAHGESFGNVFDQGLQNALAGEAYCQVAHATVGDKLAHLQRRIDTQPQTCNDCQWLTWCAGGCPAMGGLANNGDMLTPDPYSCAFFNDGWIQRYTKALAPWRSLTQLPND